MKEIFYPVAILVLAVFTFGACTQEKKESKAQMDVVEDVPKLTSLPFLSLSRDSLYDKVLGCLVGSAIGDAMGAPTEMWSRYGIQVEYGFVNKLDNMVREPSAEGTWDYNLDAGGTTDDTRWKVVLYDFMMTNIRPFYSTFGPNSYDFAQFLLNSYNREVEKLKSIQGSNPEAFDAQMRRLNWLQEWALVAKPFVDNNTTEYANAVSKFYGGEMVCGGMLYAPILGAIYPGAPDLAYRAAYQMSIFDIGYAKDITGLTAALVAAAMPYNNSPLQTFSILREIDPQGYFKSRLVGRYAYSLFRDALFIVDEAKKTSSFGNLDLHFKPDPKDTLYLAQLFKAYELLDNKQQHFPFHAGEIHIINLTALLFSDFDFRKGLEFVINYGRDNDTVAAITGAILGAYCGYDKIPDEMKFPVVKLNKEKLGIDLIEMATVITDRIIEAGAVRT